MAPSQSTILLVSVAGAYGLTTFWRHRQADSSLGDVHDNGSWPVSSFLCASAAIWALLTTARIAWSVFLYPYYFSPLRHLPQPTGNEWFWGHYRRILKEPSGGPAAEWINTIPNDGLIRYLGMLNQERLIITKPKALAEVLVTKNYDFEKPVPMRQSLARLLGVGILLAEGDEHRFQRRQLAPAFAFRHVKDLYPVFWAKTRESVAVIAREGQSQGQLVPIDITGITSRATLDIIGVAGMGRDFGALRDPNSPIAATYRTVLQPSPQGRLLNIIGFFVPRSLLFALPLRHNHTILASSNFLRQTCADMTQEKKKMIRDKKSHDPDATVPTTDILSVALESGAFSDANLADQLMTFLAAGHETTSSALTWAIYLLCCHPDIQERLRAEIRAHLPSIQADYEESPANEKPAPAPAPISSADIDRLPYLNAVCSEVLRLFAPVPSTIRESVVDTTIAGQFVPRGTVIFLVPWAVNKSEELWGPTAGQFDPERWLRTPGEGGGAEHPGFSSGGGATSNYAFLTFLHGPRSCIGMGFARAEFACLLAGWVGHFSFRLRDEADLDVSNIKIRGGISARPGNGLHVYATPIDGW